METGVRFESVLMAGFSIDIVQPARPHRPPGDLPAPRDGGGDPSLAPLRPAARARCAPRRRTRSTPRRPPRPEDPPALLTSMPSLFCLLVLSGEEVPDLMQKLAGEHPDTDPMIKAVSKYHRQEEARHLAFARMLFPEQWAAAGRIERFLVRYLGSHIAIAMFDTIVHPGSTPPSASPHGGPGGRQPHRGPDRAAPPGPAPAAHAAARSRRIPAVAASPRVGGSPAASTATGATYPSRRLTRSRTCLSRCSRTTAATKGDRTARRCCGVPYPLRPRGLPRHLRGRRLRDAGLSTTASYPYSRTRRPSSSPRSTRTSPVSSATPSPSGRHTRTRTLGPDHDAALSSRRHPSVGRSHLRGLEPDFTMRLLNIPALEGLRKTLTELIRPAADRGEMRRDIDPARTATAWWSS